MRWRVLTVRLPREPSRHRVAAWRELRRLGAVSLAQGVWAIPEGELFDEGLDKVVAMAEAAAGSPLVLTVTDDDAGATRLEALFTEQREAEWTEFLSDCAKFEAELADEVAKGKLTLAELDEEEQSLDRLRRWFRQLRAKDVFGASNAPAAERRLKEVGEALDRFAEAVYEARERP